MLYREKYTEELILLESEVQEWSNRKVPDRDEILNEMFKATGEKAIKLPTSLCQQKWIKTVSQRLEKTGTND